MDKVLILKITNQFGKGQFIIQILMMNILKIKTWIWSIFNQCTLTIASICCTCFVSGSTSWKMSTSDGIHRLRNRDGWSSVWGRFFQTKSVMGRLWDDHFRQLGHPPKFYRLQDASSGNTSPVWYDFKVNLMTNHYKQDSSRSCTFKIMLNESPMNQKVFDWNSKHGRFKGKLIFRLGRRKRRQTLSLCSFIAVPGRYSICWELRT